MLSCLDSKRARSYAHQFAWRLGMPFIDAGVSADGLLARVNVYLPGAETACMECGWTQDDYDAIEQTYPCQFGKADSKSSFSTNAPSSLGALAASLQAIEVAKFLGGQLEYAAVGREVVLNALPTNIMSRRFPAGTTAVSTTKYGRLKSSAAIPKRSRSAKHWS